MTEKKGFSRISDEAILKKTCKSWDEWFKILDTWDVKGKGHAETAKHLLEHFTCLNAWWAQAITIRYEKERGLR